MDRSAGPARNAICGSLAQAQPTMSLILAIEPDRRQRTKLAMLARNQLHADLVTTDSVEQALAALDEIVPDLILTSAVIPAREGIALADRLRELDAEGLHVPTMVIPVLAVQGQRMRAPQRSGGAVVRGRNGSNPPSPPPVGGCDPVVFGMQVLARLDRAGVERDAEPRVSTVPSQITRAAAPATFSEPPSRNDVNVDASEQVSAALSQITRTAAPAAFSEPPSRNDVNADTSELETASNVNAAQDQDRARHDWSGVLSAMRRDIEQAHHQHDERMALAIPLALEPSVPAFVDLAAVAPIVSPPAAVEPQSTATPAPVVAAADATRKRRRRQTPPQDEWGVFDPQQCGVSALIAKVNEISRNTTGSTKKPG